MILCGCEIQKIKCSFQVAVWYLIVQFRSGKWPYRKWKCTLDGYHVTKFLPPMKTSALQKCYTTGASRHWKMGNRDSRDERRTTAEVPVADWLRCTESLWTAPPNCSGALSLASNRMIFHWLRRWLAGRRAPPPTPKEILKLTVYFN